MRRGRVAQQCPVRQHQSAFVPLGPQVEKDVPKRLIQLVRTLFPLDFSDRKVFNSHICIDLGERAISVLRPL